jgi:uncharacterized Ntn-hydrolase superfamily protein
MVESYQANAGKPFASRLVAALQAGLDQGGETGPSTPQVFAWCEMCPGSIVDLRVDWSDRPIAALEDVWTV